MSRDSLRVFLDLYGDGAQELRVMVNPAQTVGLERAADPKILAAKVVGLCWGLYEKDGAVQDALWVCRPFNGAQASPSNGGMVALWARDWCSVNRFHDTALAHGGASEGAPGLRLLYNPDFYAAYVRDPDGNKLAVVCRGFTSAEGQ